MGCLIEGLFELLGEVVIELVLEGYLALMLLIVPSHSLSPATEKRMRTAVKVMAVLLFLASFFGALFWVSGIAAPFWKCVTLISLGIIAVQIVFGIVVKLLHRKSTPKGNE